MRLGSCNHEGDIRTAICGDDIVELLPVGAPNVAQFLSGDIDVASMPRTSVPIGSVKFLPPIVQPDKIFCVGINYRDHAAEASSAPPEFPSLFARFSSSQVGHLQPIVAPSNSSEYDFEGELAVIIGRPARHVSAADALRYVGGYSCFAENSVRDFQRQSRQVTAGKNFEASGAFGPWVTTADEVPDPAALTLVTRLNGIEMQRASVGDLIFPIAGLIAYISSFTTLLPGDVIATGTPSGIGALRKPPLWMKAGDTLEIDIPGVGLLINQVVAEAKV